jgi:glycosyltransferase involved in cell wall biosynthesis
MTVISTDLSAALIKTAVPLFQDNNPVAVLKGRVAVVGPGRNRACGLATFTNDILTHAIGFDSMFAFDHISVLRENEFPGGQINVQEGDVETYHAAARAINEAHYDAIWIQHEFGIFGGAQGAYIVELAERVAAPLIVTFHTILQHPSAEQRKIMQRLIAIASRIMVMSAHGRDLLVDNYGADPKQISVIEHGAPDRPLSSARISDDAALTLSTFGLLGPGKGLETALLALAKVKEGYANFRYRIIGATHPNLLAKEGEAYRDSLKQMVVQLGLESHVEWVDKFLDIDDLLVELDRCQIYLTPYPNLQQSTSGTLSYAVALGKAVISTPFIHAKELLSNGCGKMFEPGDSDALASAILELAFNPSDLEDLQARAYARGRTTIWPKFVGRFDEMVNCTILRRNARPTKDILLTTPGLVGFKAMVDGTGMLQHSHGLIPNRAHGYCVDDNVRALMLMNHMSARTEPSVYALTLTFCSFIQDSFNPDTRRFRNFMRYDRHWLEDTGSEDSNGRTIWSLGHAARFNPNPDIRKWASEWFDRVVDIANEFGSPRAKAFSAIGAAHILEAHPDHEAAHRVLHITGEMLFHLLGAVSTPDWTWFEAELAYDNPRLPEALIKAGVACGQSDWVEAGLNALRWINRQQVSEKRMFRAIGSEGFGRANGFLPFDQQPVEAWSAIDACVAANEVSPDEEWSAHAELAMLWFHGHNDRHISLVDVTTGTCRDGITPNGVNENRGAESILAFQLAYQGYMQLAARKGLGAYINDDKLYRAGKPAGYSRAETDRRSATSRLTPVPSQLAG